MNYTHQPKPCKERYLEIVTVCVGFGDMLKVTLAENHPHADHFIVVTSHEDKETQFICHRYGATCVQTDLIYKNGRNFNKGAAINAGFGHFQWNGWRLHIDSDIILPDNFRRVLFNHTDLEEDCLYGADRVDMIGMEAIEKYRRTKLIEPQSMYHSIVSQTFSDAVERKDSHYTSARYIDSLHGYVPIGYFQLWHASKHKRYPWSLGTAAHDDILFGTSWPLAKRRLLPSVIVGHTLQSPAKFGMNWNGDRGQPRLDGKEIKPKK